MNKYILLLVIISLTIVGCSPATPQPTQTPLPTNTPIPTSTINPCSDQGWNDISTYVSQFFRTNAEIKVGDSISILLGQLENIKSKVNNVSVAACTEFARQKINAGLTDLYTGAYYLFVKKDGMKYGDLYIKGLQELGDASVELKSLTGYELLIKYK